MKCDTCGNEYENGFEVMRGEERYAFDSFECAAQKLSPTCEHCGCRILGHGVQADARMFCCGHCARESGVSGIKTRVEEPPVAAE